MAQCEHQIRRQNCSVCKPELVYKSYQSKAKERELSFALTLDQFKQIVQQRCVYCGEFGSPRGVDRRDNCWLHSE
jgi:hypothetical protein